MTDETKKLFNAPWKRANNLSRNGSGKARGRSQSRIVDASDRPVAYAYPTGKQKITANRLARLPELYDALEEACELHCHGCLNEGACKVSYTEKPDEHCCIASWIKLLRKVRCGE